MRTVELITYDLDRARLHVAWVDIASYSPLAVPQVVLWQERAFVRQAQPEGHRGPMVFAEIVSTVGRTSIARPPEEPR